MTATGPPETARAQLHVLRVGAGGGSLPEGVEERAWAGVDVELPAALVSRPLAAIAAGSARIDVSPLAWADVLVLCGPFATIPCCLDCGRTDADEAALIDHARESGHPWRRPTSQMVRGLAMAIEREPGLLRSRGLVLEAGADPVGGVPEAERDLVRLLLRTADRVVVADEPAAEAGRRAGAAPERVVVAANDRAGHEARRAALLGAAAARDPARLARRLALRAADGEAVARLREPEAGGGPRDGSAGGGPRDGSAGGGPNPGAGSADGPLVSVVVVAGREPLAVVTRAIASALACTGIRLEVVVAGGPGSAAVGAVAEAADPRVRHTAAAGGSAGEALAAGMDAAAGAWIAPLDAASVMAEDHPSTLLGVALEHGLDAVYAQTLLVADGEPVGLLGAWPPAADTIAPDASLLRAGLRAFRPDPDAAADGEDPHWNLWRRLSDAGARLASIDQPLALREAAS